MNTIVAMPTTYKGYRFRSRLEARWAMFYDKIGVQWEFEPQPILVNGEPYLPDFRVIDTIEFIRQDYQYPIIQEVKPFSDQERITSITVYLAGKIGDNWRGFDLFINKELSQWENQQVVMGGVPFTCSGPFASSWGHGDTSSFKDDSHGSHLRNDKLLAMCKASILRSDMFCAHIASLDAFGTLVELGFASAFKKIISLSIDRKIAEQIYHPYEGVPIRHDMWFAKQCSQYYAEVDGEKSAQNFHAGLIGGKLSREYKLIALVGNGRPATITFGDPLDVAEQSSEISFSGGSLAGLCRTNIDAARLIRAHRFDNN